MKSSYEYFYLFIVLLIFSTGVPPLCWGGTPVLNSRLDQGKSSLEFPWSLVQYFLSKKIKNVI